MFLINYNIGNYTKEIQNTQDRYIALNQGSS